MTLAYADYTKLVLAAYQKKLQNGELSPLLATITRGSIRQQCFNLHKERLQNTGKEERNVLEAFFGHPDEGETFASKIEFFDLDKFRQLEKLLKKGVRNPGAENVELLAWLIDFPHRPYGRDIVLSAEELGKIDKPVESPQCEQLESEVDQDSFSEQLTQSGEIERHPSLNQQHDAGGLKEFKKVQTEQKSDTTPQAVQHSNKKKAINKRLVTVFISAVVLFGCSYMVWQREQDKQTSVAITNGGCMYWTGEEYKMINCDEKQSGHLLLPLDTARQKEFKRITREDTITEKSIWRVYYIKNKGTIEYYTAGGMHPVEATRYLIKLSPYMFDKYLKKL